MTDLPTVITAAGLQPQAPASLLAQLLAAVTATNPGYTATLPGSLIEDISSTDVASIALCDSARVDLVNSLTPYGANLFLLVALGNIYGVVPGTPTNTSVFVQFNGPAGFVIAQGFTVSDGTYQYIVQDGGIILTGDISAQLYAVATVSGTWAVPSGTVTQLISSVPNNIVLTVTNPEAGTPSSSAETAESFRARVLQAGLAISQGMTTSLKNALMNVPGVQPRLVSVLQQVGGGWEVICGGGDPYAIADAIFMSLFDISTLTGSVLNISNITQANPGVVTTILNHGFATGQVISILDIVGMTELNNTPLTIIVISEKTFSVGVDTSAYTAYISGGVITPNLRNITPSVQDYPNSYIIPYVNPPQQTVALVVTWNTSETNFVSTAAISQAASPALVDYINSIVVGQPINVLELNATFLAAVANIINPIFVTRLIFAVSINGIGTSPESGTQIIVGDPESYFETDSTLVVINQG